MILSVEITSKHFNLEKSMFKHKLYKSIKMPNNKMSSFLIAMMLSVAFVGCSSKDEKDSDEMGDDKKQLVENEKFDDDNSNKRIVDDVSEEMYFVDARDGQSYKYAKIGFQLWMTENLKTKKGQWTCYDDNPENCEKYGMLYDWNTANKACPEGWHLPMSQEWDELFSYVGGRDKAGIALKSKEDWINGAGSNMDDFSVLPAGAMNDKKIFVNRGYSAFFWSSTESKREMVEIIGFNHENQFVSVGQSAKYFRFSVRCVKDRDDVENKKMKEERNNDVIENKEESSNDVKTYEKNFVKIGSQKYKTVKINNQIWMAENLNWKSKNSKCYKGLSVNCKKYGQFYNWTEAQTVCPEGWHLPSQWEWESLIDFAGGLDEAGNVLKSKHGWNNSGNGTDLFGFTALPAGNYDIDSDYQYIGYRALFWSSTDVDADKAIILQLNHDRNSAAYKTTRKWNYFSIRCVMDD